MKGKIKEKKQKDERGKPPSLDEVEERGEKKGREAARG